MKIRKITSPLLILSWMLLNLACGQSQKNPSNDSTIEDVDRSQGMERAQEWAGENNNEATKDSTMRDSVVTKDSTSIDSIRN